MRGPQQVTVVLRKTALVRAGNVMVGEGGVVPHSVLVHGLDELLNDFGFLLVSETLLDIRA